MTVEGTTVLQVIAPTREEQLQREINDLCAQLELKQAQLEDMAAQLEAAQPGPTEPTQEWIALGGGFIAEADGWIWLVWEGKFTRLRRATPEETRLGDAVRAIAVHRRAERARRAS